MRFALPRRFDHRPWPCPARRWTMRQSWRDLLFAHWPIPVAALRPLIPERLKIQEFDGTAWIGIVPFRMENVTRRGLPNLPWVSAFPELNVRTYVEYDGKPGVWFLSLDAPQPLAIWAARRFYHLPYRRARMEVQKSGRGFDYTSRRGDEIFHAYYQPASDVFHAASGSLDAFLVERYCLYAQSQRGRLYRGEIHHDPWPLQKAEGRVDATALLAGHGLTIPAAEPLLHYTTGVDVMVWPLEALG